jgi:CubicO group peptidase (beta-lactamase class C family)
MPRPLRAASSTSGPRQTDRAQSGSPPGHSARRRSTAERHRDQADTDGQYAASVRSGRSPLLTGLVVSGLVVAACGTAQSAAPDSDAPSSSSTDEREALTPTPTIALADQLAISTDSTTTTTTISTSTSTSTTSTSTTSTTSTTISALPSQTATTVVSLPDPAIDTTMTQTNAGFDALARNNAAASMTVRRDGVALVARASGNLIDGAPATSASPMLVASVSKVITAFTIAKLEQRGDITMDQAMPWEFINIPTHPAWADVTIRELLDHTSGMPVARSSWFGGAGDCRSHLPSLVSSAPQSHRGTWRYSNGNYCALGLLIETLTASPLDEAARTLVFDPLGIDGPHLSTNGLLPTDVGHAGSVERLDRLGGAGVFVASTDSLAAMIGSATWPDYFTIQPPGVFVDQYGWGHTGTVEGAISCIWLLENGRTAVAATIAGNSPSTGGGICDRVVPAVANDLGIGQGRPDRTP